MAYHNTGYARRKTLTVTKGDYSHRYEICNAFTAPGGRTFGALTEREFARLPEGEYQNRLAAFCAYVYAREDGLQADCPDIAQGAVEYDPDTCPLDANPED